jgi:hypothetical protein
MQIQSQLSEDKGSANMLSKPAHMISFIKQVLENSTSTPSSSKADNKSRSGVESLRFVPEISNRTEQEGDSDDEDEDEVEKQADDEMIDTALNLLLSILEGSSHQFYKQF